MPCTSVGCAVGYTSVLPWLGGDGALHGLWAWRALRWLPTVYGVAQHCRELGSDTMTALPSPLLGRVGGELCLMGLPVPSLQETWEGCRAPSVTLWALPQGGTAAAVAPHQLLPGLGPAGTAGAGSGQGRPGRVC